MFYMEEDIQPVVDVVVNRLGRAGTMSYGKNILMNVVLETREFGAVWYGDFEGTHEDLAKIATELSTSTGYTITATQ